MSAILTRLPETRSELYECIKTFWGITIPSKSVCVDHTSPFDAFADAYFATYPVTIWRGARATGGKSFTLATLSLTEAVLLGADVNLLGGSGAQSQNVHDAMNVSWNAPLAPHHMIEAETQYGTRLDNGAKIKALLASQRSVRGPHPQRLRLDEIDEMDLAVLDASMGQPMPSPGIETQIVLSSTHHNADGTMTEILRRAQEYGFPVYSWCYKESSNDYDGWLKQSTISRIKESVTEQQWRIEFELQEPAGGDRAIDTDAVDAMFVGYGEREDHPAMQVYKAADTRRSGEMYEFEGPDLKKGEYVTAADWAKQQDFTVVATFRTDCDPWRLVAFSRTNRKPYPYMVQLMNDRLARYGGVAIHDATGLGDVVSDYLDQRVTGFLMTGRQRDDMLTEFIAAVEDGKFVAPMIATAYGELKYASNDDVYSRKQDCHLPDTFCAFALAWYKRGKRLKKVRPMIEPVNEMSPWKAV